MAREYARGWGTWVADMNIAGVRRETFDRPDDRGTYTAPTGGPQKYMSYYD